MTQAIELGFRPSPQQQRVWRLHAEGGTSCASLCALRLEGDLDRRALRQALTETVARHEILRTAFRLPAGLTVPLQIILPPRPVPLPEVDVRELCRESRATATADLLCALGRPPFDLQQGEGLRAALVWIGPGEHELLLALSAACADAGAFEPLAADLLTAYTRRRSGRGVEPEPPLQYADVAEWQNGLLEGEETQEGVETWQAYWREHEIDARIALPLPLQEREAAAGPFAPREVPVPCAPETAAALARLAAAWGCPRQDLVLTAWMAVMQRGTGRGDSLIGRLYPGRDTEELRGVVGPLARYLPLAARVAPEIPLREAVAHIRQAVAEAEAWGDYFSWEHVNGSGAGGFPVCFEAAADGWELTAGGLRVSPVRLARTPSLLDSFSLALACAKSGGDLRLALRYDPRRFRRAAAHRLAGRLAALLGSIAARPEAPLADHPALPEEEMSRWLGWSVAPPAERGRQRETLHQAFEEQAARTPDRLAVVGGDGRLTFRDLDVRANRLAHHLRAAGAGPEVPVALCLERSAEAVVALLALWKAGAVHVPLDPTQPAERLAYLLSDVGAPLLVTRAGLATGLPGAERLPSLRTVLLDEEADAIARRPADRPAGGAGPCNLAYVIYTSGSTGRPKGVQIEHRSALHLLAALETAVLDPLAERGLLSAPLLASLNAPMIFDASVQQLVLLLAGHALCVVPADIRSDGAALLAFLREQGVDLLDCTPSQLRLLVQEGLLDGPAGPRIVLTAGEAVDEPLWKHLAGAGRTVCFNLYGPTECSVDATFHRIEPGSTVPVIGRPLPGYEAFLLDRALQPVPPGAPGEICLGGTGLARGYLRRPDLTSERFVPHPFARRPGERLYRTGDLGRHRPDGALEFLGRLDHQVKIRGFRIELGEIEAALGEQEGVREAVVVARESTAGDRRLVAYVVGDATADLEGALRRALRERLPEYMVPGAFVRLSALPLTPQGKVDRNALPAPEQAGARQRYVAPRTREEEILAAVWAQVLRLPRVGVNDNFFELGGDSILSVQIAARARQAGLLLSVRQIFEHQTVAELARHARAATPAGTRLGQGPVEGPVPLTPIQSAFFAQAPAEPHHHNQALLLEPREPLSPAVLERALAALVEHHDALRLRFHPQADGWRQENAPAEPVTPFHQVDLSSLPAPRLAEAFEGAAAALQAGFDLAAGPLTRLCLFQAGSGQPERLLWTAHHLVVDGVSWRVLLEDLEAACRQAAAGQRIALPPKTTSFQEWARRLAAQAGSEALARELDFWGGTARAAVPPLPVDFPSPAGDGSVVGDEAMVAFELTPEETADLLQTVPSVYHSRIDETLLSALARALADWAGAPSLRVDLEGHGREPLFDDLDVSRTVGWFTSVYPVVLEAGDAGPGDALVSVKESLRAVPGRGIGYGLLRHLGAESARLLREAPPAEIGFNYLGQVGTTSDGPSLFRVSTSATGPTRSPRARRAYLLDVSGIVAEGRLRVTLTYGSRTHRRETAEHLAAAYAEALRQLIEHCRTSEEVLTPSDFPKAALDARRFHRLATLLSDPFETVAGGLGLTLKNVADVYPLSPLQNGLLFHALMAPESGVYVGQFTCTFPADLDARLFRQAWEMLVERHGVLRTLFLWDGIEEAVQVVRRSCALPWQDLDWRGLPAAERQRRFEELRLRERHAPLPLDRAPLMRFCLIRLGHEHAFLWTSHHLLMDGWSLPLLVQELRAVYAALREGREPVLPPARPFSDYIAWLRQQDAARAEPFWRAELAGLTAPNALGLARPAETAAASGSAEHGARVSREVTEKLQALAAAHRLTLQTVTLGAWAVLVSRYSGDEDVVFGSVISGRPAALPGVETMIGLFINTLPVRVRVPGAERLAPWLQRLQERQLARQDFEHTPLSEIQRWSAVPAGVPLFETLYVFENYPVTGEGGPEGGLPLANLRSYESTSYPLTLTLKAADQIVLQLMYDRARMDEEAVPRLLRHLATLLAAMAEAPEAPLDGLGLLTAAEALQLRAGAETVFGPLDRPLHARVEDRADRTPEAVALTFETETLTYGELDRRANRLARHLRTLGVGAETRVAVLLERTPELVVALLAILKAGGAYVPLDLAYPAERIAFLLADSAAAVLLTEGDLARGLPPFPGRIVRLDADRERIAALPAGRLAGSAAGPGHLAYVIYTSGSTGRPKGVQVTHANVLHLFAATAERFAFGPVDVWTFFHSVAFDFSVWEIWGALLHGGRLVLVPHEVSRSPWLFLDLLTRERVTVLNQTPSAFAQLAQEDEHRGGVATALRLVIFGGEALDLPGLAPWFARHGDEEPLLVNMYGITETTVHVTARPVRAADAGQERRSLIGRPIPGLSLTLVDPGLRPVPRGVPGEIAVGGAGLARGYLGRPELTAGRFVPDPLGETPGARLYRSGDLGRLVGHGDAADVEYLGRIDHQVKIRGFRIELGEIEAALAAHPRVREAIVVAREDGSPGDRRLVAYLVADLVEGGGAPRAEELRQAAGARLPDYMVPASFVVLDAFPLTPHGKVDRKALPAPDRQGSAEAFLAPRTPAEEVLCGIWAEVLGLDRVGAGDHFFELGGHSLLATRVLSRLRGAFGIELPLRDLFTAPRLEDLAARIEEARRAGTMAPAPPLRPVPRNGALPLSFAQRRLWFVDQLEPGSTAYNVPVALRVAGALDPGVLARTLGEIVRRHEALRTVFAAAGGSPVQVIQPAGAFPLAVVDLSGLPEGEREALALTLAREEAARPFDLARGPLLRGLLLRLSAASHVAALTLHHIASDGWSMGLLVREVTALYQAFAEARPSPLPELPVQYADFAVWQRGWLGEEVLERLVEHWRRRLAGAPPQLDLAGARPRPAVLSPRGSARYRRFSPLLLAELRALGRRESATLFMTLLAPLQALLHARSGATDLVVGTDVAGRDRREVEGLIGFFINQLPLRTSLAGDPTLRELLGRARETALEAYAHQDLPFDLLVEALRVEQSLRRSPVFQVKLVLQNLPEESLDLPGLSFEVVRATTETAQLDLHWGFVERGEELWTTLTYSTDLYDEPLIDSLLDHYELWLRAFAERPEARLGEVAAGIARAEEDRLAERGTELKSKNLGKLRSRRRQTEELLEV